MRIVEQTQQKIKELLSYAWIDELMWIAIIMFIALGSFSLGILAERRSIRENNPITVEYNHCLLYTSPSPRDKRQYRMPSSA